MAKIKTGRENKPHIGIFGRVNAGKSSLMNFITSTETSIVSPREGTTTDPVRKSYEITGFSPVIFIDTGGIDDFSQLGRERIAKTEEAVSQVDLAIIVFRKWGLAEQRLADRFDEIFLPYVPVHNGYFTEIELPFSLSINIPEATDADRDRLLETIKEALPEESYIPPTMLGNLVKEGDKVILVCPIDNGAPAGRMILPQMQAVREVLDRQAMAVVVQPETLEQALQGNKVPSIVITDSQVYREVRDMVPESIEVTTFSILLAAAKGDYGLYCAGLEAVDTLREGDRVLIAESCSHQISCDDIGRVKIPAWLEACTGKKLDFTVVSGTSPLPEDLGRYSLMVQCGGCMVTRRQLLNRIRKAAAAGVPVTNYGMLIRKIRP